MHVVTILLIADQDRLEKLFDFVSDSPQISFRVSRSLRQGSQDIAEEAPDILFVQNHLSGLSGEIISRHLMGQVEGTKPRVVLFGETGQQSPIPGALDACLDITSTDEELTAAIIGILSELPSPQDPVKIPPPLRSDEPAPAPSTVEQPLSPDTTPSTTEPPIPVTDTVEDFVSREASPGPPPPKSPFDEKLTTVIRQSAEPVPLTELEDTVTLAAPTEYPEPPPAKRPRIGRKNTELRAPLIWIGLAALAAVSVGAIMLLTPEAPSPKRPLKSTAPTAAPSSIKIPAPAPPPTAPPAATPASPPAATPPAVTATKVPAPQPQPPPPPQTTTPPQHAAATGKGLAKLPSFIPREGHDQDYGKSHPGWERYRGARTEFKVYHEGSVIRAVQAIDRSGVGIPESFLRGALNQMSNTREFTLDNTETQGKFRVEKGTVNAGARIVVYRTVPKGAIRAFVVHFN